MPAWVGGVARRGDGRGRALGFPTANLELFSGARRPADGVYAAWVKVGEAPEVLKGAVHVGPRPTFAGAVAAIEVHILDFPDRDLYGERVFFQLVERVRDIKKFSSPLDLIAALNKDCEKVRARLA